jgi:hypothetical protein
MTRIEGNRMDAMERKLDQLIELSHQRQHEIQALSLQVSEMAPTVKAVADAVTFAKIGRSVFRVTIGMGVLVAPVIWWMQDKWLILGQLFKRAG